MGCGQWHDDVRELWGRLADEYGLRIFPGEMGIEPVSYSDLAKL